MSGTDITKLNLHGISDEVAAELCAQLRETILDTVSQNGGHLASSLGTVELTVAIHRVFDLSKDRLVFDVGHQCYSHKLLTGRDSAFHTLRTLNGVAGYPKPSESVTDAFIAGHASNSVSVALGMARARTLCGENHHVLALMGDGALTGGLAYEGLANAGQSGEPMLVILNDNGMSITENVGGLSQYLAKKRLKPQYLRFKKVYRKVMHATPPGRVLYRGLHRLKTAIKTALLPCSMFEDMGFTYMGPVDGHNVNYLTQLLRFAKQELTGPVLLHVRTVKGKGYLPAERSPEKFHGVGPFDLATGEPLSPQKPNYSSCFGDTLCQLARENPKVCAITAAMQSGTGLDGFARQFPERFFDVGIAEGHGVSMAAGMAKNGLVPVFAVYSSFLQRGYDMLIHDVAISRLPVIFAVDRAGLVGEDGETHHGLFDVAYLSSVPGMKVLSPSCFQELRDMLRWAVDHPDGPVAIRYPRGGEGKYRGSYHGEPSAVLQRGDNLTMVCYGSTVDPVLAAAEALSGEGFTCEVVKLNHLTELDWTPILESVKKTGKVLLAEECAAQGGLGERLAAELGEQGIAVKGIALLNTGDGFIPHGTVAQLREMCGLDENSVLRRAKEVLAGG